VSDSTSQDSVHNTFSPIIAVNRLITTEVSLSIKLASVIPVISVSGVLWQFMLMFLKHQFPVQGVLRDF
jgi:hypothetical protein